MFLIALNQFPKDRRKKKNKSSVDITMLHVTNSSTKIKAHMPMIQMPCSVECIHAQHYRCRVRVVWIAFHISTIARSNQNMNGKAQNQLRIYDAPESILFNHSLLSGVIAYTTTDKSQAKQ